MEEGKETVTRVKCRRSPRGLGKPREATGKVTFEGSFGRSRIFRGGDGGEAGLGAVVQRREFLAEE